MRGSQGAGWKTMGRKCYFCGRLTRVKDDCSAGLKVDISKNAIVLEPFSTGVLVLSSRDCGV